MAGSGATQAYEIAAGDRDGYSLAEMGISGGVGGLLGPGVRAAGHAVRAYRGAKACGGTQSISPRVRSAASKVEDFLGKDMVIKRADNKGFVALNKDGTRRFRLDLQGHGDSPHGHIEIFNPQRQRWVDAGPEHRYYFKGKE
ncbi:MAG: hypothetical protein HRU70_10675 [Phycisphaeraceae bacterium]|nr:MAG: hypothetical protein HRU70_10675 [Phycisphaeraceae bacterium]